MDQVYPELVIRDEMGKIQGVRYDELAPMLLNEIQQERAVTAQQLAAQAAEIKDLRGQVAQMASLEAQVRVLQESLAVLQTNRQLVAER